MCETKYEDGIWFGRYDGEGDFAARFVVNGRAYALRSPKGDYKIETPRFQPIRRVADLDGRPVVDASVIEAIAKDIRKTELKWLSISLPIEELTDILKQHLSPSREQGEPDERPIVNFPGAFRCWWKDGTAGDYTAWPSLGGIHYMRNDGHSCGWVSTEIFDKHFTRTRPITLPPEQEKLVGPIVEACGCDEAVLRKVLAGVGSSSPHPAS